MATFCNSLVSLMYKQMFSNGWLTVLHICYDGFETLLRLNKKKKNTHGNNDIFPQIDIFLK